MSTNFYNLSYTSNLHLRFFSYCFSCIRSFLQDLPGIITLILIIVFLLSHWNLPPIHLLSSSSCNIYTMNGMFFFCISLFLLIVVSYQTPLYLSIHFLNIFPINSLCILFYCLNCLFIQIFLSFLIIYFSLIFRLLLK